MKDNDWKIGLAAVVMIVVGIAIGVLALIHLIVVLFPLLVVGVGIGGYLWLKNKS